MKKKELSTLILLAIIILSISQRPMAITDVPETCVNPEFIMNSCDQADKTGRCPITGYDYCEALMYRDGKYSTYYTLQPGGTKTVNCGGGYNLEVWGCGGTATTTVPITTTVSPVTTTTPSTTTTMPGSPDLPSYCINSFYLGGKCGYTCPDSYESCVGFLYRDGKYMSTHYFDPGDSYSVNCPDYIMEWYGCNLTIQAPGIDIGAVRNFINNLFAGLWNIIKGLLGM